MKATRSNPTKTMTKRLFILLLILASLPLEAGAVLKEKDLDQTLDVLRSELTTRYTELSAGSQQRKERNKAIIDGLIQTMRQANQNALMLYSQQQEYVFDLTYACHQATEQYQLFHRQQLPFRQFIDKTDGEVAKYDSLVQSLQHLPPTMLSQRARTDRNVCLTLATSIRNMLDESRTQMADYMVFYESTGQRLKTLNDYAQKRYYDIQTSIFRNGGDNYLSILRNFSRHWTEMKEVVKKKYNLDGNENSQWSSYWISGLFIMILFYVVVAIVLNQLVFRFLLPRRFHTERFMKKRPHIIMATTVVTFAVGMGLLTNFADQDFLVMASDLLVEFAWLMGVILISLLLRLEASQITAAFRIYAPLIVVGFIVIAFRIILIPSELVNIIFPPILLVATMLQWMVIRHHNQLIPRSDIIYSYISLLMLLAATCCALVGYTLFAVQMLIWWIMQLTCILTITCVSLYVSRYGERHGLDQKPITQNWAYKLLHRVLLPIMSVLSVMLSIYWAAGVFNLTDLCWRLFNEPFVNVPNLRVSILKLSVVVCLWFIFRYIASTVLELMRMHFQIQDPTTAASREVMGKNVIQVIVWGAWLLISLSILNISVTWLVAISGGLSTGIGFASKDIIENIYYGASLMAGRIKVGDWIQVDGTMGRVSSISYTSTIVESLYGEVITFQNSQLFSKNYKNLTKNHGYVLAVVPFSVAYGSNLRQVTQLVEEAVNHLHHQWMDNRKQVKAVVSEMADSSVNFNLFVWADAPKKSYVVSDVLKCIYETLNEHNIEIPFPQQDVHLRQ